MYVFILFAVRLTTGLALCGGYAICAAAAVSTLVRLLAALTFKPMLVFVKRPILAVIVNVGGCLTNDDLVGEKVLQRRVIGKHYSKIKRNNIPVVQL